MLQSLYKINREALDLLSDHDLLESLVRAEVLKNKMGSVDFTQEDEKELLKEIFNNNKIESEADYQLWLEKNAITSAEVLEKAKQSFLYFKYCEERYKHKLEARFLERKDNLDQVIYSLIRVRNPFLARELHLSISENESEFAEMAALHSEGSEKASRGIIGPTPIAKVHPQLAELLRSSKPGEIREPIQIEEWYLVVRLESLYPATLNNHFINQMKNELFNEEIDESTREEVQKLVLHFEGTQEGARIK